MVHVLVQGLCSNNLSSRYAGSCSIVSCLYVLNMGIHMFGYKSSPCDSTMSSRYDIGCGHISTPSPHILVHTVTTPHARTYFPRMFCVSHSHGLVGHGDFERERERLTECAQQNGLSEHKDGL